ncbi:MAG: hypothetical protein EZS28_042848, partial [Streblomastix strix]
MYENELLNQTQQQITDKKSDEHFGKINLNGELRVDRMSNVLPAKQGIYHIIEDKLEKELASEHLKRRTIDIAHLVNSGYYKYGSSALDEDEWKQNMNVALQRKSFVQRLAASKRKGYGSQIESGKNEYIRISHANSNNSNSNNNNNNNQGQDTNIEIEDEIRRIQSEREIVGGSGMNLFSGLESHLNASSTKTKQLTGQVIESNSNNNTTTHKGNDNKENKEDEEAGFIDQLIEARKKEKQRQQQFEANKQALEEEQKQKQQLQAQKEQQARLHLLQPTISFRRKSALPDKDGKISDSNDPNQQIQQQQQRLSHINRPSKLSSQRSNSRQNSVITSSRQSSFQSQQQQTQQHRDSNLITSSLDQNQLSIPRVSKIPSPKRTSNFKETNKSGNLNNDELQKQLTNRSLKSETGSQYGNEGNRNLNQTGSPQYMIADGLAGLNLDDDVISLNVDGEYMTDDMKNK